ncbi:hypothetical protein [Vibrio sagamiensis]|uniref:Uncharacterized protein n=1 Tax=Vibrio sagamiensis NBRC 104589 TaxID=1219064 RepID=A0A511QB78_9VIBR|nr:hypothetical protein [Vibrio sagamiensis]GEM74554.1 hypothetical protein VSA01S_06660 [Vibrio sagamiensis NBRC 104589]
MSPTGLLGSTVGLGSTTGTAGFTTGLVGLTAGWVVDELSDPPQPDKMDETAMAVSNRLNLLAV